MAPSRDEIARCIAEVAAGRFRRPVLVLGIDGAYVPTRPESARGAVQAKADIGPSGHYGTASGVMPKAFVST